MNILNFSGVKLNGQTYLIPTDNGAPVRVSFDDFVSHGGVIMENSIPDFDPCTFVLNDFPNNTWTGFSEETVGCCDELDEY